MPMSTYEYRPKAPVIHGYDKHMWFQMQRENIKQRFTVDEFVEACLMGRGSLGHSKNDKGRCVGEAMLTYLDENDELAVKHQQPINDYVAANKPVRTRQYYYNNKRPRYSAFFVEAL